MTLLALLILAHLLADYPLQIGALFRLRLRSVWGDIIHGLVFGVVATLLLWPPPPLLAVGIAILTFIHIVIDRYKMWLVNVGADNVWIFLADQALHLAALVAVGICYLQINHAPSGFLIEHLEPIVPEIIFYAIGYVITIFVSPILLYYLAQTFFPDTKDSQLSPLRRILGGGERAVVTTAVICGGSCIPIAVALAAVKGIVFWWRDSEQDRESLGPLVWIDLMGSAVIAAVVGIALAQVE